MNPVALSQYKCWIKWYLLLALFYMFCKVGDIVPPSSHGGATHVIQWLPVRIYSWHRPTAARYWCLRRANIQRESLVRLRTLAMLGLLHNNIIAQLQRCIAKAGQKSNVATLTHRFHLRLRLFLVTAKLFSLILVNFIEIFFRCIILKFWFIS